MSRHLEIVRAPHGRAVIEMYLNGRRTAIGHALSPEVARDQAEATGLRVIDHTRAS